MQVDRGEHLRAGEWLDLNRSYWEGRVRDGAPRTALVESALASAVAPRVLHLGSGDGAEALALAARGAEVIGVDFAMPAVRRARDDAARLELTGRARFLCANLYESRHMLPEPDSFDVVLTTAGTVSWLPDLDEWARIVEWFVRPGGVAVVGPRSGRAPASSELRTWSRPAEELAHALRAVGLTVREGEPLVAAKGAAEGPTGER
ncbi:MULTISPECIES: class I SAM-dependent methyltransferase [unclassified Rathayibacter]|uniref:class I SAM-dependent methyltransferase n=1 Tax=unclassified Rathayibacter TaxID=2609250 RepID=UPI001E2BB190|nr:MULTISPECIES: class I SAM-dependent methyltransferase [unclassified Rathayibacter]